MRMKNTNVHKTIVLHALSGLLKKIIKARKNREHNKICRKISFEFEFYFYNPVHASTAAVAKDIAIFEIALGFHI
jgi:hypothetical protein